MLLHFSPFPIWFTYMLYRNSCEFYTFLAYRISSFALNYFSIRYTPLLIRWHQTKTLSSQQAIPLYADLPFLISMSGCLPLIQFISICNVSHSSMRVQYFPTLTMLVAIVRTAFHVKLPTPFLQCCLHLFKNLQIFSPS